MSGGEKDKNKIPYRIKAKDDALLALAGVWDVWTDGTNEIKSFSIITTTANEEVSDLHLRMPVIFEEKAQQEKWLDKIPLNNALDMLQPIANQKLDIYRVSDALNSAE